MQTNKIIEDILIEMKEKEGMGGEGNQQNR